MVESERGGKFERRYSLEELSQRWQKPISTIEEWIRLVQFKQVGATVKIDDRVEMTSLHFQDENGVWKHRGRHRGEDGEPCDIVVDIDPHEIFDGLVYADNEEPFIPESELFRFEEEHNLGPVQESTPPTSPQFNWIKTPLLKIAVEAYHDLYALKKIHQGRGHKSEIIKWLDKRHGKLSKTAKNLIATIVNPNRKGGAPPMK